MYAFWGEICVLYRWLFVISVTIFSIDQNNQRSVASLILSIVEHMLVYRALMFFAQSVCVKIFGA